MSSAPSKIVALLKPKRRWFQFTLRTFFIVLTIFCVWLGFEVRRARKQAQAVEEILSVGGHVSFKLDEKSWVPGSWRSTKTPPNQTLLRRWLGDHILKPVTRVTFSDSRIVNGQFKRYIDTYPKTVSDEDLVHLSELTSLQSLSLYTTDITDEGLKHLYGLVSLRWLILEDTNVTDDGVKKLQQALPDCNIIY